MSISSTISSVFISVGRKTVSKTDKQKNAYVLNKEQISVLENTGVQPSTKRPAEIFQIHVLGDRTRNTVKATYYHSERKGAGRPAEPRLGSDIISGWLNEGDELLLATDGSKVFATKLNNNNFVTSSDEAIRTSVINKLSDELVMKRAKAASKEARKIRSTSEVYVRDQYIIEIAKRRAKGKCEMPGCKYKAFVTENGEPYLEGHHVEPLADGGGDVIANVAAICPTCHREQHYSKDKMNKRAVLKRAIIGKVKNI